MAQTTGIAWTDATVNFVIGCTRVGPGCERCYAAEFSEKKFNIVFEPGGRRHVTKSGFNDPPRWQRHHDAGREFTKNGDLVPVWVFACSLSDFFDNEWTPEVRTQAWAVIKACPSLRWQIVTKRVGNVAKMLPDDWNEGRNYRNVGIIATTVNQTEVDRDVPKLIGLLALGVHWIGLSIEPQLSLIRLKHFADHLHWVICGGESKTGIAPARIFQIPWAASLLEECRQHGVPFFMKQMGDTTFDGELPLGFKSNTKMDQWPSWLRVQEMPRVYNSVKTDLFT